MKTVWRQYRELISVLPSRAQRFLIVYSISLGLLAILDGLALALLAVVITPIVSGTTLTLPVIGEVDRVGILIALGVVCVLIILKGVLALLLVWRATRTFARYELELGARLFDSYIRLPWVERLQRNSAEIVRLTDSSVNTTISGYLLPASTLLGEVLSFVTVVAVLAIAQPLVALVALLYLGLLAAILFFWVTKRSRQAGLVALRYSLRSSRLITEMVGALKEITLRNKTEEIAQVVRANRVHSTRARSNSQFLSQVPRYVIEAGIIGGFVIVGVTGFLTDGVPGAATAVALFGLAGFRIAPSIVRFQGIVTQVSVSRPHAEAVLANIRAAEQASAHLSDRPDLPFPTDPDALELRDVHFKYAPDADEVIRGVSLSIPFGSTVAFVGSSGAGKSTMIDLILGLIEPKSGTIEIDGLPLTDLTNGWRSRVAYVPQDVSLFDSTVAQNVALTWGDDFDRERVRHVLAQAQLLESMDARPDGIDTRVGERGLGLSGGQRQRLGISRALYSNPLVLVMDEATSALDTTTEAAVTDAIRSLRGSMTIITVAHRLSTVKSSDVIFFMSGGTVVAHGTFDELVAQVPEFAIQAALAGLADAPED